MAVYNLSSPLTGSKVEELLLRVNNNQDFTSGDEAKLDSLENQKYVTEDNFTDTTTQTGILDTPKNVLYGPLKTSPNELVRVDADGVINILKAGPYAFKTRHRVARTGASGVSKVFQWVEISVDGGSTWTINGNPVDVQLAGADDTVNFFDFATIELPAGVKLRARFARSSTGADFGSLTPSVPSASLISAGVPTAPSAQLTVYRVQGWEYV